MRAFRQIFATLAICTLLTGPVAGAQWTTVPPTIEAGYAVDGHVGLHSPLVGYGHSAYSEQACMAPAYGMDDVGSNCDHWRNTCCDNAWAGYCGERGLLGRRTSSSSDCGQQACSPDGSRWFSLLRWSPAAEACAATDECCTEGVAEFEDQATPLEP